MSKFNAVIKETIRLVEHIQVGNEQITKNIEKYNKQISEELLGVQQGKNMVQEEEDNHQSTTRKQAQALLERLDRAECEALEYIESNNDPVTSDNVAELQLLAQIDTTSEELNKYADKYNNNTLALRMIEKIAKNQDLMFALPESAEEKTKKQYSKVRSIINRYSSFTPNYKGVKGATEDFTLKLEKETLEELLNN